MGKQAWREFYQWLNTAADEELLDKKAKVQDVLPKLSGDSSASRAAIRIINLIDEEVLSRIF